METLKNYKIPQTDLTVSRVAYGCGMIGFDFRSPDFVAKTVPNIHAALEQGINFFDTADIYGSGNSERALGEVVKHSPGLRSKIVLQTKCGVLEDGSIDNSRKHVLNSVEGSLKRLYTDHIDVLLLHWPDDLVEPEEVARAFDELHESGKVRYFGVSNHNHYQVELLQKAVRQPLVTNQIQLGLAHWNTRANHGKGAGAATLGHCRVHNIQVQAYAPLRVGDGNINLLKPQADARTEIKNAAQLLQDVANNHSTSPSVVMLAWLLRHPAQIIPIIGTTKPEHIIDNCAADRVEITRAEWYSLLEAASRIELA